MKEFVISEAKAETAVLVGLITKEQDEAKTKEYLDELEFLADTAGAVTVKRFTQKVGGPSQTTYVGSGKLQEIKEYIKKCQEKPISSAEKDPYIKCYCSGPADSYLRFYPKYYIVSTLTSNYIVFNKDSEIEPEAIAFCVFESIYGESRDIVINYNISEGFDNIGVYVHIEEWDKTYGRTEIGIEQKYNSQKKKWNPQEKYEYNWGFVSTDV